MVEAMLLRKYTLGEKIRENDICIIYAGKELKTDRPVTTSVIKTKVTKPADFLSRFTQIAQKISRIESPHLVKILDSGEVDGQAVIVSEEVEGRTLSDLTGKGDSLPLELVLGIACQLGEYLDALHRHGLYQVVFEPASITLTADNIIRVLDLGLAQGLDVGALLAGGQLKPSACHAPELLRGEKADSRTDFYSLGVLLFNALTGKEPQVQVAEGKTPILRHGERKSNRQDIALADFYPSHVRPDLAPELDELIARCLHPNPSRRIQSAAEFLNKVEEVRRGMEVGGKDTILGMEGSLVGQTLGTYRLVERLGQGGMATVYKAYEAGLDRYVAIKVLPQFFASDPSFTQRFRREAKAVAQLNHPNIVPIYNFGEEGGITYIAMQLMQGGTLKRERGQVFGCEEALRLLLPITRALGYAHAHGIVHRDIKPSNVLMTEGNWPVLADFGLAQMVEASIRLTGTGVGIGTPAYMSPEQGQGAKVDHRTDIYSLGVMLYEMVTGDIPFKADTPMAIVIKHLTAPMPLPRQVNPEIPEDVEKIILKATAKNPDERFQTSEELALVMERLLEEIVFARKSKIVVQGKKPQKISPTPAPISKVGPAETGYPQASRQRQDKTTADNLPFTQTGAQPGIRRGGRRIWVIGGLLATLILGIGGGLFWLGKNGPPAMPAPIADNTATPTITGKTITVTSAQDSRAGTLRQALLDAQSGDTITFDPVIFPPDNPATIYLTSGELPRISQGGITIDASNAGVDLNGSKLQLEIGSNGLVINSDHNTVMGLLITQFGSAIYLEGGSYNIIGGDRTIGAGPLGQGNLLSNNFVGIGLLSMAGGNVITGNLIGTDMSGTEPMGNWKAGIWIEDNQTYNPTPNIIGPDNLIAFNGTDVPSGEIAAGVGMDTAETAMTITGNSIYDNAGPGIFYNVDDAARIKYSTPPVILYFDLDSGVVNGQACIDCIVEIFSTESQDGKIYEGTVTADEYGNFSFSKGAALTGPYLTATTTSPGGNTSEFSQPTSAISAIQIALDAIQNEAPLYQTSFDTWDFGEPVDYARVEDGKLIATSESQGVNVVNLHNYSSDSFGVEFEFRILEAGQGGGNCVFNFNNTNVGIGESLRGVSATFSQSGLVEMGHYVYPDQFPGIASGRYDMLDGTKSNTVTLIILGDQIAAFINGQLAYTALNPDGIVVYTIYDFQVSNTICEYDNYKFWDLSGVDFSAATPTTRLTSSFASILDSVSGETPDYEDDFSNLASGWSTQSDATGSEIGYQDGAYLISAKDECYGAPLPTNQVFSDFVLEMDTRFIDQGQGTVSIFFRNNEPAHYGVNLSPQGWVGFHKNVNDVHIPLLETEIPISSFQSWDTPKHLTLIARQDRMAIYVNGELVIALADTSSSQGTFNFGVCNDNAGNPLQALIDNLKIWDITDLSP